MTIQIIQWLWLIFIFVFQFLFIIKYGDVNDREKMAIINMIYTTTIATTFSKL